MFLLTMNLHAGPRPLAALGWPAARPVPTASQSSFRKAKRFS
ncbi:hypothetical protein SAMN04488069_101212 [Hymenobacter psychrophilus]|uniref:Uncharacterized protein n=1 Tax=Hymenobacter psychrophilus TaxID=651662 RepID=A0A1H3BAU0_9BACT|nr:hypothetical protein SAMN04488069_101212 [Hymenobacter psychrophilus]